MFGAGWDREGHPEWQPGNSRGTRGPHIVWSVTGLTGIYWTLGRYDTVVMFEAPYEKAAMNMVLKRADRMDIEMLVAVPADASSPAGPV